MPMKPDAHYHPGKRGMFCPQCDEEMGHTHVADSYPAPGGHYRTRYCSECHCCVETLEAIVGHGEMKLLDVSDLEKRDIDMLRQLARRMREGKVKTKVIDQLSALPGAKLAIGPSK